MSSRSSKISYYHWRQLAINILHRFATLTYPTFLKGVGYWFSTMSAVQLYEQLHYIVAHLYSVCSWVVLASCCYQQIGLLSCAVSVIYQPRCLGQFCRFHIEQKRKLPKAINATVCPPIPDYLLADSMNALLLYCPALCRRSLFPSFVVFQNISILYFAFQLLSRKILNYFSKRWESGIVPVSPVA